MYKEQFKNKTILITGGVKGIGFECAKKFVSLGSKVIVTCKTQVNYDLFKDDLQSEKMKVKNELLIKLINNSKNFFKKNGILINWKELSKLSSNKQIYNLAMISPISVEETQKLLEIVELEEIANILNDITKLNFYEFPNEKNILQ